MTATYTPGSSSSRNTVRLLIGDTDTDNALLQDEEIDRCIAIESNTFQAAALALDSVLAKWNGQSGGLTSKRVDDLEVRWGSPAGLRERIAYLRARGNRDAATSPAVFKTVGSQADGVQ